jgi:hypothetical protein
MVHSMLTNDKKECLVNVHPHPGLSKRKTGMVKLFLLRFWIRYFKTFDTFQTRLKDRTSGTPIMLSLISIK